MSSNVIEQASQLLNELTSDDAKIQDSIKTLRDIITGNISGTGIAIGPDARVVVQQFNLSAEQVATLLEALSASSPIDSKRYELRTILTDRVRDFVGREHVFQEIKAFLEHNRSGYLVLQGSPGLGKSAILAEYVRMNACISHFNVRSQGIVHTAQFLENVCSQLIRAYGLPYEKLRLDAKENGAFLSKLLQEVSDQLNPGDRVVIVVDALDEVDLSVSTSCSNILCLPDTLPEGVFFVMTRRDITVPLVVKSQYKYIDLDKRFKDENRSDVQQYLRHRLASPQLQAWIAGQMRDGKPLTNDDFVNILTELSENNFMYLRFVINDIEKGIYKELSIDKLPKGLEQYYEDHWNRMGMKSIPLPRLKIYIVYILSEVREPISRTMITNILIHNKFETDPLGVQEVLEEWTQFFFKHAAQEGWRYSIYHTSFRDFLNKIETVQAAGVTIKGINETIARYLWDSLFPE